MANKKGKGGKAAAKAADKAEKAKDEEANEEREATSEPSSKEESHARSEHEESSHGHGAAKAVAHGPAGAHAHHKPNLKEYFVIFLVLFVLTVLEVGVAKIPGLSKKVMGLALVGLAVSKAACVGLYYMHLKHETKVLKLTVALPFAAPAIYALVLIGEAAWRIAR